MTFTLLVLPVLFAAVTTNPDGGAPPATAVTGGGSAVPIAAPKMEPSVSAVIAPELSTHGAKEPDGTPVPIIAKPSLSVYNVDIPAEAAVTVGAFGLYVMVDIFIKPTLQAGISCQVAGGNGQCDPNTLSGFDRYAVGKSSRVWSDFSDVALASAIAIPVLYLGLESLALPTKSPWADYAKDLVVVAEAMAVTAAADTVLKFAFRRPRPSRYLPDPPAGGESFDAELSLPSGHAGMVAAATTALTTTIFLRHPKSKVRFVALGAGVALSVLTAVARVESGAHFPTDVITGLVVGGLAGFVVPYLHRKQLPVKPSLSFNPATGATMLTISGLM